MRIMYDNQWDSTEFSLSVSSTAVGYPSTDTQDISLAKRWRTDSVDDQYIQIEPATTTYLHFGLEAFSSFTNIIPEPLDLTTVDWTKTSATVTATTLELLDYTLYAIQNTSTSAGTAVRELNVEIETTNFSNSLLLRRGTTSLTTSEVRMQGARIGIDWENNTVTYTNALGNLVEIDEWIDDKTVKVDMSGGCSTGVMAYSIFPLGVSGASETTQTLYHAYSQVIQDDHPFSFSTASKDAVSYSTSYTFSNRNYTFDICMKPFIHYTEASNERLFQVGENTNYIYRLVWFSATDTLALFVGSGTYYISSTRFDDGTSYVNLNQELRINIDYYSSDDYTNSVFRIIEEDGTIHETTSWVTTSFVESPSSDTVTIGARPTNDFYFDGNIRYAKVYEGNLSTGIDTEDKLDDDLKEKELLFEKDFKPVIKADSFAIGGHNIGSDAEINVYTNDYDEWEYIDGGSSSITKNTVNWREGNMIKFVDSDKKSYAKITIDDPNNTDGYIEIGRVFLGEYLQVDPSSLIEYDAKKIRTDNVSITQTNNIYSDEGVEFWQLEYDFPVTPSTMMKKIEDVFDTGKRKPFFFVNYDEDYTVIPPIYAVIVNDLNFKHSQFYKYEYGLNIREVK